MTVQVWLDGYARAWEEKDAELAAAELFTEACVYRDPPFAEPHLGRDGVRYWTDICAPQEDPRVRRGAPVVSDDGRARRSSVAAEVCSLGSLISDSRCRIDRAAA